MDTLRNNLFSKFLIVWLGQLISNIGSGLTAFTLGVFVYQKTHSATSYALIIFFSFLPSLLLKPVGAGSNFPVPSLTYHIRYSVQCDGYKIYSHD